MDRATFNTDYLNALSLNLTYSFKSLFNSMGWFVPEFILHCPLVENELKAKLQLIDIKRAMFCKVKYLLHLWKLLFISVVHFPSTEKCYNFK